MEGTDDMTKAKAAAKLIECADAIIAKSQVMKPNGEIWNKVWVLATQQIIGLAKELGPDFSPIGEVKNASLGSDDQVHLRNELLRWKYDESGPLSKPVVVSLQDVRSAKVQAARYLRHAKPPKASKTDEMILRILVSADTAMEHKEIASKMASPPWSKLCRAVTWHTIGNHFSDSDFLKSHTERGSRGRIATELGRDWVTSNPK